ncbi:helix-turn-helix domain-containing protein [Coraliomargarita algicola]|uniref:Helix-turn-helix domain-containing protein n=1 Tax=Coraliomargarita algicola TaxID=3092156 RepID=A0ABZ0RLK2_9BACT|nr:helix-turn-helix domain-containing protein [Coraliomargarita sp. J2-16]WPJ97091.1 helix-turn-helix domain-containing protein [Coraliomargarita sp. J2-16]
MTYTFRKVTELSLADLIEQVESLSGLQLCLKVFDDNAAKQSALAEVPLTKRQHFTPFCQQVKIAHDARCVQCDLGVVTRKALEYTTPFFHVCHAGAMELIIPLVDAGRLLGIAYLGQFRAGQTGAKTLPEFSESRMDALAAMGLCLQAYLLAGIGPATETHGGEDARREQLLRLIQSQCHQNLSLESVARHLGVSVSRAGHIVKELTGRSFMELKQQMRLDAARQMLLETRLSVESIAAHVGYEDVRYFYRVFTTATGVPPGQWRSQHVARKGLNA